MRCKDTDFFRCGENNFCHTIYIVRDITPTTPSPTPWQHRINTVFSPTAVGLHSDLTRTRVGLGVSLLLIFSVLYIMKIYNIDWLHFTIKPPTPVHDRSPWPTTPSKPPTYTPGRPIYIVHDTIPTPPKPPLPPKKYFAVPNNCRTFAPDFKRKSTKRYIFVLLMKTWETFIWCKRVWRLREY